MRTPQLLRSCRRSNLPMCGFHALSGHTRSIHPQTPPSQRSHESTFAEPCRNDARKRQNTSNFNALVSAPGAKRLEVPTRPKSRCRICPPPLRKRAPSSQNCRLPRRTRYSGSRSIKHPLCKTYHGKMGGSIRASTSLSYDGRQLKSCSGCLDPRDKSTISIASRRLAPRAKKGGHR